MFHHSGGGPAPMCCRQGEFAQGDHDVLLSEIGDAPFFVGPAQFVLWKHTQLIIDVVAGCAGMFSLESGEGARFLLRSYLFASEKVLALQPAGRA